MIIFFTILIAVIFCIICYDKWQTEVAYHAKTIRELNGANETIKRQAIRDKELVRLLKKAEEQVMGAELILQHFERTCQCMKGGENNE